jgi:hypothetical protein
VAARSHLFAAVRHPSEPKLLLLRSDRAWRLPHVLIREAVWGANARVVVPAFQRRLATRLWLLRRIHVVEDEAAGQSESIFELELLDPEWVAPAHGRWAGRAELAGLRLEDKAQRPVLDAYLDALEQEDVPLQRPSWARPGWLAEVRTWVEQEAAQLGHVVVGVEQVKQWSISAVLRVETDGPDLYFKVPARLPLFVDEAALTARLAERFPEHVPAPLAVEPERGWLLLPAFDELFGWDAPLGFRQAALRRFAGLQRRSSELVDELLADGCLDRRLGVLETQIDPLVNDPEALARLTSDEVGELRRLAPWLKELCVRLASFGLPSTLVHGDLHMLNVARLDGDLVYFDWTDACVAHPFIDLLCLTWEKDEANRVALLDAYLESWQGVETAERLQEAAALAAVVIPLHHAVSYQRIVAGLEPAAKPELDATHEFLRRVLRNVKLLGSAA